MRAISSVQPKRSHRCVSLKESPSKRVQILKHATRIFERKQKGGFEKGWFWPMCPRSGLWYRGNIRMYPRSGFGARGTSECTLVPVFGTGGTSAKTTLLETTLLQTPEIPFELLGHLIFRELISVIITPPITPNDFWGFNKRNFQEKLHLLLLSLLGMSPPPITPQYSQRINRRNKFHLCYTRKFSGN